MPPIGAVLPKVGAQPLVTLARDWGATERGWGHEARAPSTVLLTSSRANPGACGRDVQARGQEGREPPTTRPGPHAESEGAEESAHGKTVSTGRSPWGGATFNLKTPECGHHILFLSQHPYHEGGNR